MALPAERPIEVRPATPDDIGPVMDLLAASLGWSADPIFHGFFRWKHVDNPFGRSPAWVALDADDVVGFRAFLRWEFEDEAGSTFRAVRAVDTATRPSHQGRGIFRQLTMHALDELQADGTSFVFNTPNDQSRPGYLKMGWEPIGRMPTSVRLASWSGLANMARARMPAERWSMPCSVGEDARVLLADQDLERLLQLVPPTAGLRTRRSTAYLQWRYGFEPLGYRALAVSDRVADGLAIFRLRRRGPAVECALCEVLVPSGHDRARRRLVSAIGRSCDADYMIRIGNGLRGRDRFLPLPGQGPTLTWRPLVAGLPRWGRPQWDLGLGDVELF